MSLVSSILGHYLGFGNSRTSPVITATLGTGESNRDCCREVDVSDVLTECM